MRWKGRRVLVSAPIGDAVGTAHCDGDKLQTVGGILTGRVKTRGSGLVGSGHLVGPDVEVLKTSRPDPAFTRPVRC